MVIFQFVLVNCQRVQQTMRNLQGGSRALNLGFMDVYSISMVERGESNTNKRFTRRATLYIFGYDKI